MFQIFYTKTLFEFEVYGDAILMAFLNDVIISNGLRPVQGECDGCIVRYAASHYVS